MVNSPVSPVPTKLPFLKKYAMCVEPALVLQRRVTLLPVIKGSLGISRITEQSERENTDQSHTQAELVQKHIGQLDQSHTHTELIKLDQSHIQP